MLYDLINEIMIFLQMAKTFLAGIEYNIFCSYGLEINVIILKAYKVLIGSVKSAD